MRKINFANVEIVPLLPGYFRDLEGGQLPDGLVGSKIVAASATIAFCLFAIFAILGLARRARQALQPVAGSAHEQPKRPMKPKRHKSVYGRKRLRSTGQNQKSEHKQLQWQSELGRQDRRETIAHADMINSGQW